MGGGDGALDSCIIDFQKFHPGFQTIDVIYNIGIAIYIIYRSIYILGLLIYVIGLAMNW